MENNTTTAAQAVSSIRKESVTGPILVSRVYESDYQKEGTLTAELKQTIKTKSFYPTKSVSNSLQANIFQMSDFGFEEKTFESSETRVTWIDVPVGSTIESVTAKLADFPEAILIKYLANRPILDENQKYAINNPDLDTNQDTFANRQVVRYPIGAENAGEIVLDVNGKVQYRRIAFSTVAATDIDARTVAATDFYASDEVRAELNGVIHIPAGQSL